MRIASAKKKRLAENGIHPSRLFIVRTKVPTSEGIEQHVVLAVPDPEPVEEAETGPVAVADPVLDNVPWAVPVAEREGVHVAEGVKVNVPVAPAVLVPVADTVPLPVVVDVPVEEAVPLCEAPTDRVADGVPALDPLAVTDTD